MLLMARGSMATCCALVMGAIPLLTPQVAIAQRARPVAGTRVRVSSVSHGTRVGTIASQEPDSLRILVAGSPRDTLAIAIARHAITKLEVSSGQVAHPARGLLIGAAVGGVVGLAIDVVRAVGEGYAGAGCALASGFNPRADITCDRPDKPPIATLVGVVAGGLIGYDIGRTPSERWVEVRMAPVVSVIPHSQGGARHIGVRIRFSGTFR